MCARTRAISASSSSTRSVRSSMAKRSRSSRRASRRASPRNRRGGGGSSSIGALPGFRSAADVAYLTVSVGTTQPLGDFAMVPDEMTAIAIEGGKGPPEALKATRIATPKPGPGQILIKVAAAGVNRPDVIQRLGFYPPPPGAPDTMGLEVAGEVVALGAGARRWTVGDQVTALLG